LKAEAEGSGAKPTEWAPRGEAWGVELAEEEVAVVVVESCRGTTTSGEGGRTVAAGTPSGSPRRVGRGCAWAIRNLVGIG